VFAFDGATGDTIWVSSFPGFAYVMRIAVLDDVNADGLQDAAVGSWDDRVFVISGADGAEIWSFPTGGDVWTVARVEDVNSDGVNDVVAGSFDQNVYALDGTTGGLLWSFPTGNRLYAVEGVSDLTGNGAPDVLAGTQFLSGSGGRAYLLEGGEDAPTPAELPMYVVAQAVPAGIEIELGNAGTFEHCVLERSEGVPNQADAARAFRRSVAEEYRDGRIGVEDAIRARSQDPQVKWTRVSERVLAVVGGRVSTLDPTAQPGRTYTYRFAFVAESAVVGYSPTATIARGALDGASAVPPIRIHPNPVGSGGASIEFHVASRQPIRLDAYDAGGRRVAEIHASADALGDVRLDWDRRDAEGRTLANGIYFLRLEGRDFVSSEKIAILR
jgi:hypothetical protein